LGFHKFALLHHSNTPDRAYEELTTCNEHCGVEIRMSEASSTYTLTSQELASAKSTLEALQERVIIKEGDAERFAGMMVADGDLYPGSLEWYLKQFKGSGSAKLLENRQRANHREHCRNGVQEY
jgi:hypothetical protein